MIEEQKSRRKKLIISEFFPILFLKDTGRTITKRFDTSTICMETMNTLTI